MNRKGTLKSFREARNNWMLCCSKSSNPGKSYFFNVDTGESVWKGNDFEKQKIMTQNMNVPNSKYYHEPSSPPMFMPYQHQPYYGMSHTPPQFGHSSFPNYLPSEPSMQPNINRWIRTSDNIWYQRTPDESDPDTQEDYPVVVKTTFVPLNERFKNHIKIQNKNQEFPSMSRESSREEEYFVPPKKSRLESNQKSNHPVRFIRKIGRVNMNFGGKVTINNQSKKKIDNTQMVRRKSVQTQTEKDLVFKKTNQTKQKHEVACQFNEADVALNQEYNQSELDYNHEQSNQREQEFIQDQSNQTEQIEINQYKLVNKDQNATKIGTNRSLFSPLPEKDDMAKFEMSNFGKNVNTESEKLEESDLRLKLMARRKKEVDNTNFNDEIPKETMKIKTTKSETVKTQKKVSFSMTNLKHNLETEFDQNYDNYDYQEDPFPLGVSAVKNDIVSTDSDSDVFFVISDIDLLTEHWSVLEDLLKSHGKYKILIPNSISKELDSLCKGDCRGRDHVMKGRQVKRLIGLAGEKIVIEGEEITTKLLFDPIIECCQKSIERGHTVILLTKERKYERKANENCIAYFDINDIQKLLSNDQPVTFEMHSYEKSDNSHDISELEALILEGRHHKKNEIPSPILECKSPKINKTTFHTKTTENFAIPKNNYVSTKETVKKEDEIMDIEKELKRFSIKNNVMADRLKARMEEWIFRFTENMEYALNNVLGVQNKEIYELRTTSPWSLLEATNCLKRKLNQPKPKLLAERLHSLLSLFEHDGAIKANIKLGDYMRLFGLGVLLVEALMDIPEYKEILRETLDNLTELQNNIEDPTTDPEPPHSPLRITAANIMIEREKVKVPVDVREYLKRNFPYLKELEDQETEVNEDHAKKQEKPQIKIVRTLGKNADKLMINNKNTITMKINLDKPEYDTENTFNLNENNNKVQETKVVRKMTLMKEFEERMNKTTLDLDLLDYEDDYSGTLVINENGNNENGSSEYGKSEIMNSYDAVKVSDSEEDTVVLKTPDFDSPSLLKEHFKRNENNNNENGKNINKNVNNRNNRDENENGNGNGINHEDLNDSGFEVSDESSHGQSIIKKTYLKELSLTFLHIHNFIQKSSSLLKEGGLTERRKNQLTQKTEFFQTSIYEVLNRLKCVINRETNGPNQHAKVLLSKADADAGDIKLWRYRQILTKCLEQAEILKMSLNMLKSIVNDEYTSNYQETDALFNAIPYFNIFE